MQPATDDVNVLNLANGLFYEGRFEEALPLFREIFERHPNEPAVLLNYPALLGVLGFHTEGRKLALQGGRHFAGRADLAASHSSNLLKVGLFREAEAFCSRLASRFPGRLEHNRGYARLAMGKWAAGWRDMELRPTGLKRAPPEMAFTPWDGRPTSKRVHVEFEQGFGDSVMFLRYLPSLAARVGETVVVAPASMRRLIASITPSARFVETMEPRGLVMRIMSSPHLLGVTTPDPTPYITASERDVADWRARLGFGVEDRVFGVSWSTQSQSYNACVKSLDMATVKAMVDRGLRLLALQMTTPEEEALAREWGIITLPADRDFADMAAIMSSLTGVITIDTVFAHLAGALGIPLYLSHGPSMEWRWLEGRETTWYRNVTVFRASNMAEYRGQFETIAQSIHPSP